MFSRWLCVQNLDMVRTAATRRQFPWRSSKQPTRAGRHSSPGLTQPLKKTLVLQLKKTVGLPPSCLSRLKHHGI